MPSSSDRLGTLEGTTHKSWRGSMNVHNGMAMLCGMQRGNGRMTSAI